MDRRQYAEEYRPNWKSVYLGRPLSNDYQTASIPTRGRDVNIISPPVIQIPASLVVTATAYREFMRKNRLDEVVEGLLAGVNVKCIEELRQPVAQIQEIIRSSPLPDQLYDSILEGCRAMGYGATVIWPVTMPFELFHYSWEYQRFPYLEAVGPEETLEAIRSWWASLFESSSIFYRELNGKKHRDARITVAAQRTADSASNSIV